MNPRKLQLKISIFTVFLVCLLSRSEASKAKQDYITRIDDIKDFKKFVKTHTNVLVVFSKTEKDFKEVTLLRQVAEEIKGKGSVVHVDCANAKKLCKKLKSSPSSVEYKHFKDGEFHKVYDRLFNFKSMYRFMQDATGDLPWDEDASAKDVVHVEKISELNKILSKSQKPVLVMFYAPWCGFCKRLKPDFSAAAKVLKNEAIMVGMDVDTPQGSSAKVDYNITAFPTIIYFKDGERKFDYGGENNMEGFIKWMRDPHPPKPQEPEKDWSDVPSDVIHLTDDNFYDVINQGQPTLVMFYAPWCGHCKKMKPEYQEAATKIKELGLGGVLAAVDATKQPKVMKNFSISGYPTVKFFNNGEELYSVNERTSSQIVKFMQDPQKPKEPEAEDNTWEAGDSGVVFPGDEDFKNFLKKKKHSLVMFYAPWCTHCKMTKPEYMKAAEAFKGDNKRAFVAVDCTVHSKTCQEYDVTGYPTITSFTYGKDPKPYRGGREAKNFIAFMQGPEATIPPAPSTPKFHWDDLENNQVINILTSKDFDYFIASNTFVLVVFYGPTCTHCHAMRKDFIEAALLLQRDKVDVVFAAVDAMAEEALRKRFAIQSLPTIKAFRKGVQLVEFDDIARTKENFVDYVKSPPAEVEAFSSYKPEEGMLEVTSTSHFDASIGEHKALFVFFHDPSTPQCLRARPAFWESASEAAKLGGKLAIVDCVVLQDLCKREGVKEIPSFKLYTEGKFHSNSEAPASVRAFTEFLKQALPKVKVEL